MSYTMALAEDAYIEKPWWMPSPESLLYKILPNRCRRATLDASRVARRHPFSSITNSYLGLRLRLVYWSGVYWLNLKVIRRAHSEGN